MNKFSIREIHFPMWKFDRNVTETFRLVKCFRLLNNPCDIIHECSTSALQISVSIVFRKSACLDIFIFAELCWPTKRPCDANETEKALKEESKSVADENNVGLGLEIPCRSCCVSSR